MSSVFHLFIDYLFCFSCRTKGQQEQHKIINNKNLDTVSLSGSDSGVSVKSANSVQKQKLKVKNIQKSSFTVKTPENNIMITPEFVRKPVFSSGLNGNFQNQGKLRASTVDQSVIGGGSSSNNVFAVKPVSGPRTWSNSRLNRNRQQQRTRIGSRS